MKEKYKGRTEALKLKKKGKLLTKQREGRSLGKTIKEKGRCSK